MLSHVIIDMLYFNVNKEERLHCRRELYRLRSVHVALASILFSEHST